MRNDESLRSWADSFLLFKRSIGYIYKTHEYYLLKYVAYAEKIHPGICLPDKETVMDYLDTLSNSPGSLYNAMSAIREFGKHLAQRGLVGVYLIPPKSSPTLDPDPPYFFTEEEIRRFFEACDAIEAHIRYPGREFVFPTLFRLMYCCGLRCKEARSLLCENVHLDHRYIDILQSKGPKNRRVYISTELAEHLNEYDSHIAHLFPIRKYFFPHKENTCYKSVAISNNFKRFWMKAYPDFIRTSRPRAYDLRHHFVWANLNRWTKDGLDVNVMLPYLMRCMGHQSVSSTLYYFRFVPDFFQTFARMTESSELILPEVPCEEQ